MNLVYCVYGSAKHLREAQFSVLTALRYLDGAPNHYRIVVCTPRPEIFSTYPVTIETIDDATLKSWRGPDDFIYRTKIMAMSHVMDRYPAPTMLLDSDTYFARSPVRLLSRLQQGTSIMDRPDGLIFTNPAHIDFARELSRVFPGLKIPLPDGRQWSVSETDAAMWVAGVVGIHHLDQALLDQVLALTDAIYSRFRHAFVEQFAFSEVLRKNTNMIASNSVIEHYWGGWVDPYFGVNKRDFVHRQIDSALDAIGNGGHQKAMQVMHNLRIRKFRRPLHYRVLTAMRKVWSKSK